MRSIMNKKGDFESIIYVVIIIFVIGVILFYMNHVSDQLYTNLDEYFNESDTYNDSVALEAVQDIHEVENEVWDYAFLALVMGYVLALLLSAFSTRITPVFYWIYGILSLVGLVLAVIASNIWQEMAANPEFAVTITRFPIMNAILGTYYPTFIMGVMVVVMILLFGKGPTGGVQ
jgi:peptidoglycan/LPS O-acetylase OafA/YrhL